jgi:hypothetical protein
LIKSFNTNGWAFFGGGIPSLANIAVTRMQSIKAEPKTRLIAIYPAFPSYASTIIPGSATHIIEEKIEKPSLTVVIRARSV